MFNIHRKKINSSIFIVLIFINFGAYSQTKNLERFDYGRKLHFGFTIGTNVSDFKYEFSDNFYYNDSLLTVDVSTYPGITLGAISDLHLGEFFDIRVIPSLVLTERSVKYKFTNDYSTKKSVESIFAELPVLLKFKSTRHGNLRFYVIGGGKVSYDFGSNARSNRDPNNPIIAIKPWAYAYEFGCGLDMYFYWFKFSPEIKLSKGINSILSPYHDVYSNVFENIYSNFIYFSFNFEG